MAYLGNDLQVAFPVYRNIDDISGSFNSSTTSFPLRVSGVAPVPAPLYSQQCLISVGGVVQRPDDTGSEGFRLSGGNIIFASAPTTGADFFGVILAGADYINAGGNFPSGTAAVPSITFNDDLDTGIYNSGINQVSITTGGSERLRIDSAGQIESVSLGTAAAPAFSFTTDPNTGIYSPGADQVAISTGGSGRLFVDASGRVGIGTASPSTALHVVGAADTIARVTAANGSTALLDLGTVAAPTAGRIFYDNGNNLGFSTNGSEKLRITSAGLVGVGTSTPTAGLTVSLGNNSIPAPGATGAAALFGNSVSAHTYGLILGAATTGAGYIQAQRADGTATTYNLHLQPNGGNVGIGTTSATESLHVAGNARFGAADANTAYLEIGQGATGNRAAFIDLTGDTTYTDYGLRVTRENGGANGDSAIAHRGTGSLRLESVDSGSVSFKIGGSEAGRFDSSRRLLVGTSSARSNFYNGANTAQIQLEGTNFQNAAFAIVCNANSDDKGSLILAKNRGTTVGSNTIVQDGDDLGSIEFQGSDGAEFVQAAAIKAEVDGTPGLNDMPGRLVFSTTADGASSPTERMRITQDGSVLLNTGGNTIEVTTGTTTGAYYNNSGKQLVLARDGGAPLVVQRRSSDGTIQGFYRDGTLVGTISVTTTATAYNTSSDYRLKENVTAVTDGITRLQQLKPSRFNFIADPDKTVDGFLAHEVQTIVPEAITGEKDAVDDEGNPIYQGIDQSKLVPLLTAALQEAVAKIESLEARLTAAGI